MAFRNAVHQRQAPGYDAPPRGDLVRPATLPAGPPGWCRPRWGSPCAAGRWRRPGWRGTGGTCPGTGWTCPGPRTAPRCRWQPSTPQVPARCRGGGGCMKPLPGGCGGWSVGGSPRSDRSGDGRRGGARCRCPALRRCPGLARSEVAVGAAAAMRHRREAAVGAGPGRRGTRPALRALRLPQQAAPAPALPGPAAGEHQPRLGGKDPAPGYSWPPFTTPRKACGVALGTQGIVPKKFGRTCIFVLSWLSPVGVLALCSKCSFHFPALVSVLLLRPEVVQSHIFEYMNNTGT